MVIFNSLIRGMIWSLVGVSLTTSVSASDISMPMDESNLPFFINGMMYSINESAGELMALMDQRGTPDAKVSAADHGVAAALEAQIATILRHATQPQPSTTNFIGPIQVPTRAAVVEWDRVQIEMDRYDHSARINENWIAEIQVAMAALKTVEVQLGGIRNGLLARQQLQSLLQKLDAETQQRVKRSPNIKLVQKIYRSIYGQPLPLSSDKLREALVVNQGEIEKTWHEKQALVVQRGRYRSVVENKGTIQAALREQREQLTSLKSRLASSSIVVEEVPTFTIAMQPPTQDADVLPPQPPIVISTMMALKRDIDQWLAWAKSSPYFWVSRETLRWRAMTADYLAGRRDFQDQWLPAPSPMMDPDPLPIVEEKIKTAEWQLLNSAYQIELVATDQNRLSKGHQVAQLSEKAIELKTLLDSLNQGVKKKIDTLISGQTAPE